MKGSHYEAAAHELKGEGLRIGIVVSRFNRDIGQGLWEACRAALGRYGVKQATAIEVPGALEAPLALQKLAQSGKYDALIALGAVIRGETYHFEIVANESAAGMMSVQLDTGIPIANGILTTDTREQALARIGEKAAHAAAAAVEMANLMSKLDER
jgi:6,7-dimethyl-8-ribityllumazine synthase